jgi:hypothetical protein
MRHSDAEGVVDLVRSTWPALALSEEDVTAWIADLTGPLHITLEEATTVITSRTHSCRRPGAVVAAVQALRRWRNIDDAVMTGDELAGRVSDLRRSLAQAGSPVDLRVTRRTSTVITGSVRDDLTGIADVCWSALAGWSCSCREEFACHHIAALRQLTERLPAPEVGQAGRAGAEL